MCAIKVEYNAYKVEYNAYIVLKNMEIGECRSPAYL